MFGALVDGMDDVDGVDMDGPAGGVAVPGGVALLTRWRGSCAGPSLTPGRRDAVEERRVWQGAWGAGRGGARGPAPTADPADHRDD